MPIEAHSDVTTLKEFPEDTDPKNNHSNVKDWLFDGSYANIILDNVIFCFIFFYKMGNVVMPLKKLRNTSAN